MNTSDRNDQRLDPVLRWPTQRSKDWVMSFLDFASGSSDIVAIVAVGSAVRPGVPSVDIDLLAIYQEAFNLQESAPIEVDLRTYSASEIDAKVSNGNDMLIWAIMFGKVLFQRNHFWDRFNNSWHRRLPLPSPELAVQRGAKVRRHLDTVFLAGDENATHELALSYLTHMARAELLRNQVYPASRPELATQLRSIGNFQLASSLDDLCLGRASDLADIYELFKLMNDPLTSTKTGTNNLLVA